MTFCFIGYSFRRRIEAAFILQEVTPYSVGNLHKGRGSQEFVCKWKEGKDSKHPIKIAAKPDDAP